MRLAAVRLIVLASALALPAVEAPAQTAFPNRPVKILVGFTPGTAADVATRLLAPKLGEVLGQQIVIENKPGASSNIAVEATVRAPPDGYTLFMGTISNTINVSLIPNLPFNYATDLAPVALVSTVPNILVVPAAVPAKSVAELVALTKAKPGEVTYGSAGTGTILHMSGELFNAMAGVKLTHVPYKGSSQAMTDLLGGQITCMFAPVSTALPHMKAGTIRPLASTSTQRLPLAPELPTLEELGYKGYETGVWVGLMAPAQTPREVIAKLAESIDKTLTMPEVRAQFAAQGAEVLNKGPDVLGRYIASETTKWAKVIQESGTKASDM
jgi:tripartite-type tricarboxylate transporter receptor subunit TctC